MKLRKTVLAAICVDSLVGMGVPLTAHAELEIYFNVEPPPPRYEMVPEPRPGFVWHSGYWDLYDNRHVWRPGHWERYRRGYHLEQPAWVRNGERWELRRGHWARGDRDGDGVPNRWDRGAPDNPYVN